MEGDRIKLLAPWNLSLARKRPPDKETKHQKIPGDGETHSNVEVYTLGRQRSPHRANPGREWQRGGQTDTVNGGRSRQASQGAEMSGRGWWVVGVGDVQVDVTLRR